ncbi:MAG: hypothetical protein ACRDHZ_05615, partial [Ktedonobacteraceae bacterium]
AMAEAQREMPELERRITELERREREELPVLEQRVRELSDLSKSFGTLEQMAADLLTAVSTIKGLEQEVHESGRIQETLKDLDGQIEHAQLLVEEAAQAQHEVEEQNRSGKPKLEARLFRLRALSEKLQTLQKAEEQHVQTIMQNKLAEENGIALRKVWRDLQVSEQELEQVEKETRQVQQRAEAVEQRWRKMNIRRQLLDWQRLKGLSQGLADAEQHLQAVHLNQEKLTIAEDEGKKRKNNAMFLFFAVCLLLIVLVVVTVVSAFSSLILAGGLFLLCCLLMVTGFWSGGKWLNAKREHDETYAAMQEGVNSVGMMVAARQSAVRMGGNHEALAQIEREITSLGGSIPASVEAAQQFLNQPSEEEESIVGFQQKLNASRDEAQAARNRAKGASDAVAALRKEYTRLQDQRKQEDWEVLDEKQRSIAVRIEQLHAEIASAAGQEGLPILIGEIGVRSTSPDHVASESELRVHIDDTLRATEREIAILAGKMDVVPDLEAQVKIHRAALEILLARKKNMLERHEEFQASYPTQRIERAREQQATLRDALRSLQDALRLRVQPLGVAFGQTSITTAEAAARKQLEALHIALGNKESLQTRRSTYATLLKEHQESLAEHYRQLAKFSGSLGSWIIPANTFAEPLVALRLRCEREMQTANEAGIQGEFESLKLQEGALHARIALCTQEIDEIQERIARVLTQRSRLTPKNYTRGEVAAVWPLVSEHTPQDREQLAAQLVALAAELHMLEEQELELSQQLQTGGKKLDLVEARQRMEQQELSYATKKHGSRMLKAVETRLMQKTLPRIEFYLRQLLPLLTIGRYHDLRLITERDESVVSGGALQLSVWEPAAAEYISRSALSGGTADQVSLALRLAFSIAALPHELGAAPGFVLLDEPLTSSSRERMQALVDIVTGEMLGQHFEQVLFISHSNVFNPALFTHRVYVEDGLITESSLPMPVDFTAALTKHTPLPESTTPDVLEVEEIA